VAPEKTTFTGAYYPTRSYRIWNFYDRDFAQSSVAWRPAFAKVNASAQKMWEHILPELDLPPPNVDFWKIKNSIIGGTEFYSVGYTFDIDTVDNFKPYPFKEASPILSGQPMIPIHMPIHERMDPDTGLLWATVEALDMSKRPPTLHQVVFSVDSDGVRRVEGTFDFSPFDPSKCSKEGKYVAGKNDFLPRNMHSITSTKNYIIIPLTSVVFNPCILLLGPKAKEVSFEQMYYFDKNANVKFLIFDKRSKEFLTPIEYEKAQFISHQFNAYEISDRILVADMITYDDYAYDSLTINHLLSESDLYEGHVYRFKLDLDKNTVSANSLLPEDPSDVEFPQFNHNFEGKSYKYGYGITQPYKAGNAIIKIDMNDPSGKNNKLFHPKTDTIALLEPYFVQKPGTKDEDDGVIVSRGLDTSINKTRVYVLDAKTMEQVGEILAPSDVPFGFHERFYLKESFQLKDGDKKDKHSEL